MRDEGTLQPTAIIALLHASVTAVAKVALCPTHAMVIILQL